MRTKMIRWIAIALVLGMFAALATACSGTDAQSKKFKLSWESEEAEPIGVTIHKDDTKFWEMINASIDNLKTNGKLKEISEKWFGVDITPNLTDGGSQNVTVDASKDKTYQKDKIVVALDDSYPPMEFVDDDGKTQIGFDLDFARALFADMGMEVEFESTAWDQIFNGLTARRYDVIISATSITEDRMGEFLQSKPYVANKVVLLTRDSVKDITDIKTGMNDMKICSQSGTTADDLCQELLDDGASFTYSTYEAVNLALDELTFGRVDGVMVDIVVAQYYMVENNSNG
ncbi:MAG: transporter substrate-binding domain-containing protein [Clostridia bacterium]|nr:transporter substrate-binding domain-containing protein [Clostridia bacterium]